jgi:ribonuclease E
VVRDVFNEDIAELIVQGETIDSGKGGTTTDWSVAEEIESYVGDVAPDLLPRVHRYMPETGQPLDAFAAYRIDEQLRKALERKVNLPSGGSLVIDRTEALTAVDVNTGRFTGSGGNLEETVTRNNLEAAEEIARQLRLRDIGGMIVIDFIDMVLESNRELVLRRLVECLSRDRTKHQVSEVTSLGLVQLTRKRVGQGLLEAFSEPCPHCGGRGVILHTDDLDKPKPKVPSPMEVARKVAASHPGGNGAEPVTTPVESEPAVAESDSTAVAEAQVAEAQVAEAQVDAAPEVGGAAEDAPAPRPKRRRRPAGSSASKPEAAAPAEVS